MRLHVLILILFLTILLALAQFATAQEESPADESDGLAVRITPLALDSLELNIWQPLETTITAELSQGPLADAAADTCALATPLELVSPHIPVASQANVANFTNDPDDPPLSCLWGANPPSTTGYRTAWYQFTPLYNGQVTIDTSTSAYDTVLGIFTGSCGAASLQSVACNDDATGLTSRTSFAVRRNVTYYVLVADWQPGAAANPLQLNLQASYDMPLITNWTGGRFINVPRTRHTTAVFAPDIFVIGGLTDNNTMSNSLYRYNVPGNSWTSLPNIPITPGIMNTSAVFLDYTVNNNQRRQIFVPGGTIHASDLNHTNEHWVYNIPGAFWSQAAPVPMSNGQPFAYAATGVIGTGDGYYLLGGVESPGWPVTAVISTTIRNEVLFYNAANNTWDEKTPMGSARYGHVAAAMGNRICVAGGISSTATALDGSIGVVLPNPIAECAERANPTNWTPTGPMNVPRYFAHGAVGPDGRWYVYGGIDGQRNAVPEVEVYDPASNTWGLLHFTYDLNGRQPAEPAIVWPRGGFVSGQLWAIGGHFVAETQQLNPTIKRMSLPPRGSLFLPLLIGNPPENYTFAGARSINFGQLVTDRIDTAQNRYRFYEINLTQPSGVRVNLTVPFPEDMDLYLFDNNKRIWGQSSSPFPGSSEQICLNNLQPGRYYIMVHHKFPVNPSTGLDFQVIARRVSSCS